MKALKHRHRFPKKDCVNLGFGYIQNSVGQGSMKPHLTLKLSLF